MEECDESCSSKCVTCEKREECVVCGIMDYIDSHEEELDSFREVFVSFGMDVCKRAYGDNPRIADAFSPEEFVKVITSVAVYGFVKGRKYIDTPEVFREAFQE